MTRNPQTPKQSTGAQHTCFLQGTLAFCFCRVYSPWIACPAPSIWLDGRLLCAGLLASQTVSGLNISIIARRSLQFFHVQKDVLNQECQHRYERCKTRVLPLKPPFIGDFPPHLPGQRDQRKCNGSR